MSDNFYTSNLLCHFVGRSKKTDDERFELLVTIIKGTRLLANLVNPNNLESFFPIGYKCEHVGEVFGRCDCVCFCDIPNNALGIHTDKYSKFGMGFEKNFIAEQGAHPVMYVPKNYPIAERGDGGRGKSSTPRNPEEYYPYILQTAISLLLVMEMGYMVTDLKELEKKLIQVGITGFLDLINSDVRDAVFSGKHLPLTFSVMQGIANQMAYVKLYDANLPDNHPDNYYMEREWRSLSNITFSINDIKTVYLPSEHYRERFKQEFPEYNGNFYIFT